MLTYGLLNLVSVTLYFVIFALGARLHVEPLIVMHKRIVVYIIVWIYHGEVAQVGGNAGGS